MLTPEQVQPRSWGDKISASKLRRLCAAGEFRSPCLARTQWPQALRVAFGAGDDDFDVPVRVTVERGRIVIEASAAPHGGERRTW